MPVEVGIFVEDLLVQIGHAENLIRRERLVELISDPGDRSTGDMPYGKYSVTDDVVHVTEFRVWMYH